MPLIIPSNSITGGYEVDNSLRFDDGSTDYLNRTFTTPTDVKIGTLSFWIKLCNIDTTDGNGIIGEFTDTNNRINFKHTSSATIDIFEKQSGSVSLRLTTDRLFRDFSAWYHIVLSVDTTQATASNRIKLYVNGVQETSFSTETYPSQNYEMQLFKATEKRIGQTANSTGFGSDMSGYMSEVIFVDGQQLDPTSFGEFDEDSGIWKPIDVSGLTFGTNGFYLDFENSGSLGADVSGNSNDFTVNNLTSIDQTTDTPTNNFATLNPLLYSTSISYTEGNLKFTNTSSSQRMVASSIAPTTGKWYAECRVISLGGFAPQIGVLDTSIYTMDTYVGALARGYGYASHGQVYNNAGAITTGLATYTTNDIIGVALDLDNNYVYFSKNGTFINSGVPTSGSLGTGGWAIPDGYDYSFGSSSLDSGTDPVFDWNFGNPPFTISSGNSDANSRGNFEYAVPDGYFSLCTANLAEYG